MKRQLPTVLSVTALVIAIAGITPVGQAARDAAQVVRFARNADKVDGIHASRTPKANRLLALNGSKKFPASVFTSTGLSALEIVSAVTATDSSSPKSVTVTCAAGKRVVGGGARATGAGAGEVGVTEAYPSNPTQWVVLARELDPIGTSWTLTAYAFCAAGT
jgi:hypothetical protein